MESLPVTQPKNGQRRYKKATQAAALAHLTANDFNKAKTAKDTGIPRSTIVHWSQKMEDGWLQEDDELRELYEVELEGAETILRQLWVKAVMEMMRGDRMEDANMGELNAIFGTAFDKWRLASGQSTENVEKKVRVVNVEGQEL